MEPQANTTSETEVKAAHPVNQITPFSKYLALALFIILPFVGGYIGYMFATSEVENRSVTVEQTPALEVETSTSPSNSVEGLVKFEDSELGFSFMYPAEFGAIKVSEETGDCFPTSQNPDRINTLGDSCRMLKYAFSGNDRNKIFLVAETKGHEENPIGRGGFWGDFAGTITENYLKDCDSDPICSPVTSEDGIVFAKYKNFRSVIYTVSTGDEYRLFNPNSEFFGIIISTHGFATEIATEESDVPDEIEKIFEDTIIKTFKFENLN